MQILRPDSLEEALALVQRPGARAVAGGTAWQLDWSQGKPRPEALVALGGLLPWGVSAQGAFLRIGAGTTLEEVIRADLPLLSVAALDVAAPNIRRLATLGGTLGWGAGCLIPALLALGAWVVTPEGPLSLGDWLVARQGLVLDILFPRPSPEARLIWRKVGLRAAFTPSVIVAAGVAEPGQPPRLAVGGGLVRPQRLTKAEAMLAEALPDDLPADLEALLAGVMQTPDCAHRSARYRTRVAAAILARGLRGEASPAPSLPDAHLPDAHLPDALSRQSGGPRWHIRPDMPAKVAGRFPYLTDERSPDMLIGRILRAAHPHARILAIDTSAAEALPGVRAVVTAADIAGQNAFGIVFQDQPALCADRVRHLGDPVAAVAAVDAATAEAALALIRVDYAPLPILASAEAALAPGAEPLHPAGNLVCEVGLTRGDVAAGFAGAVHVVEDTYVTPRQMHGFMETEGGYASPLPEGGLLVAVGGQHGARDRLQLSRILARPEASIRVVSSPTGGAFGGKDELTVQPALALLALKAGAAVRLHLSRAESVLAGIKRNPFRIRMRTACDAEGRLVAQEVDVLADCGAYASLSPGVLETAMEHAAGPYVIPHVQTRGRLAYTNNGICGAFRGFGANQMAFAVECQIDRLAALCGLTPAEIRRRNLRAPGAPGYLGQRVAPTERLAEMLERARLSPLWIPPQDEGEWRIGTGMALMWQGNGLGSLPEDQAEGLLRLAPDGAIEVVCGLDEMGQGLMASLQAVVAERLGCARTDVRPVTGDTGAGADSGSTTASRGGYVVWKLAAEAGPPLAARLLAAGAMLLDCAPQDLCIVPGGLADVGANGPRLSFAEMARQLMPQGLPEVRAAFAFPKTEYQGGNARFIFCAGATLARVAVSRLTGEVRPLAVHLHSAVGPVIDLASYLGQMEGGTIQGLGFTLSEDIRMAEARHLTRNLDSYMMPGIRDVPPELAVTAREDLDPGDPFGPRGAGELGIAGISPALANAVAQALGRWPSVTPFGPEALLEPAP